MTLDINIYKLIAGAILTILLFGFGMTCQEAIQEKRDLCPSEAVMGLGSWITLLILIALL